jgi:hypothetical protein
VLGDLRICATINGGRDDEEQTISRVSRIWARDRYAAVHELHARPFLQYCGFLLSGLACVLDRGCFAHSIYRMVAAAFACAGASAGIDLSQPDRPTYICVVARILWLVRSVNYGT